MPRDLSYITSERFIHDNLRGKAGVLVQHVLDGWRQHQQAYCGAIAWPTEPFVADDGATIEHEVFMPMRSGMAGEERVAALERLVKKTKAYGVAVSWREGNTLHVLFESHHGSRAWTIPLMPHGDVLVPGETQVQDDVEHLGLLWSPHRGTS